MTQPPSEKSPVGLTPPLLRENGPDISPREVDWLQYRGYQIPKILYPVWAAFAVFALWYLAYYGWSDLVAWVKRAW